MKIKIKFMMTISVILLAGAVLMMVWSYYSAYKNTLKHTIHDDAVLSGAIHESVKVFMNTGQQESLDAYLEKARKIPSVCEVRVIRSEALEKELGPKEGARAVDALDRQVLRSGREISRETYAGRARAIRLVHPILAEESCRACHTGFNNGDVIAALSTTLEFQESLDLMVRDLIRTGFLQFLVILLIIGAIFRMFDRFIMKPVMVIGDYVKKVGSGDLTTAIDIRRKGDKVFLSSNQEAVSFDPHDEIGELALAFNRMSRDLQKTTVSLGDLHKEAEERKKAEDSTRVSQERFRMIFERSAAAIMLTDDHEHVVSWNKFTEDLLGMKRDDISLRPVSSFYPPEEWRKIRSLDIRKTGVIEHLETVMLRKDGSRVDVDISISVIKDNTGKVTGSIGIARNISDRKKAEEALNASMMKLDIALKSAHMGVWQYDILQNRRIFDEQSFSLLGIDPSKFSGKNEDFFAVVHPEDRERVRGALRATIEHGVPYEPEYRVVWPDGSVHYLAARAKMIRDSDGKPQMVNGILWDVSGRKEQEEKDKKQVRELEVFYKASIGRESRIVELKKEVENLKKELGR